MIRQLEFRMCENKDGDQLYIPFFFREYEISICYLPTVTIQAGLYQTWSETSKPNFLMFQFKL